MQVFFARLHLATQVGCSPSALRRVMQTLEATILETTATWEQDGVATGDGQEIIGAGDETFLEQMVLLLRDLKTGYVVLEETADDRSYGTWKALVEQRLGALNAQVRSLGSDRAKALIQLAEKGLECLSIPDFFHLVHDIGKSYSLALGQRLKQARQEFQQAEERVRRYQAGSTPGEAYREATHPVERRPTEVRQGEARPQAYRQQLATLSLTLHPFAVDDAAPQTSAQVEARLYAQVEAIEVFAQAVQLPERPAAMTKVNKQGPAVATLIDFWWQGVRQD